MWDNDYEKYLKLTKNRSEKEVKIEIHNVKRLVLSTAEEYIIHDQTEIKYDPLGNVKQQETEEALSAQ